MITRIREVRRARGMTLDEVAQACTPPTTPQTVGRLETGMRTVSVGWLNRIDGGGASGGKLQLLPPGAGGRQQVVVDPAWVAVAVKLVRGL